MRRVNLNRILIIRCVERGEFVFIFKFLEQNSNEIQLDFSLARLPIGRGVRARRYKLTNTSMTTTGAHGQSPSNQNEINNNSNSMNVENNNDQDSCSVSDEENTSEYGQSPPVEVDQFPQEDNRRTTDKGTASLVSSMESDNILNNNNNNTNITTNELPDRSDVDDDTSGAYYNALTDSTGMIGSGTGLQRDTNDNEVGAEVRPQQVQVK